MTDLKPQNATFNWATVFLRSLGQQGVKHIIISPGSRSTPLTLAAAAHPHFHKHIILDERSAAFTALGIGKATNKPALLICTSGTAVANYFPGVIEARQGGVPMILATADRPPHLRNSGTNQAIDQINIFGDYPVYFQDLKKPSSANNNIDELKEISRQAYALSIQKQGPAHLNFPFQKPLEPTQEFLQKIKKENSEFGYNYNKNSNGCENQGAFFRPDDELVKKIASSKRPLVITGQLSAATSLEPISKLAKELQAPFLSENGYLNEGHNIQGFDGFLRSSENLEKLAPDLILRFGLQPASKSVLQAVEQWNPDEHIHLSDTDRQIDIARTTDQFISWAGTSFDISDIDQPSSKWLDSWKEAEQTYFEKSRPIFNSTSQLTDGHIYRRLLPMIPDDTSISISNSLPARDQSLFARFGKQTIYTNRGVSGIDGITSTAMGESLGSKSPVVLFTGDLAFLHDSNALLNHKLPDQPLVIVVINNAGGSIFRMLPIADQPEYFESYFETPQQAKISGLADSHNIPYHCVDNRTKLHNFELSQWIKQHPKCSVIECQTNAEASMQMRKQLWDIKI